MVFASLDILFLFVLSAREEVLWKFQEVKYLLCGFLNSIRV